MIQKLSATFNEFYTNFKIANCERFIKFNRYLIYHTPKSVLNHFRRGTYENNITKDNPTKGYLPWKTVQKWINRALIAEDGFHSSQELNTTPLAETFFAIYDCICDEIERPLTMD